MLIALNLLNPSYPPFSKGRIYAPLWQRGDGEILINSIIPLLLKGHDKMTFQVDNERFK
jgi:hypothetical protein